MENTKKTFFDRLSEVLIPIATRLGRSRYLNVIRDAFMLSFPLVIFGSIAVIIMNLPFLSNILSDAAIVDLRSSLSIAQLATMNIAALILVFGIGYYLSKSYEVEPIFGAVIALVSFFIVTPFSATVTIDGVEHVVGSVIPLNRLGGNALFVGMVCGFIATEIYRRIVQKNVVIKMPAGVPDAVGKSFAALIPATITLLFFLVVNIIFTQGFNTNLPDEIFRLVQQPLIRLGGGLIPTLVALFFVQLLWFFGLHGQVIVNSVMDLVWIPLGYQNLVAHQAGEALPNIITKQFIETFTVGLGGSGMTFGVLIAIFIFVKNKHMRNVASIAITPGVFNVNEPVTFGIPVVLNPIIAIPWIIGPIIVTTFNYFAMASGIVPLTTGVVVPWTVPLFFSGMMATNSIAGGILQIINVGMIIAIWLPFLKIADKIALKN